MTEFKTPACGAVTVAIATTGRRAIVGQTIAYLARLKDRPDRVIISVANPEDIDTFALPSLPFPLDTLTGPKGSCTQRNAVLEAATGSGVILFLDDDFLIADGYIAALRRLFTQHEDVVMSTGRVLADGIHGPGFTHEEGLEILAQAPQTPPLPQVRNEYSVYGCNMAIRVSILEKHPERFDEDLPLYGWLEDMDLSRRMARHGRIVKDDSLLGVHLGTKIGRSAGVMLGYSQIANPVHMLRKGSVQPARVLKIMAKNILSNLAKSLWPEPWIDRRGRMRGNVIALYDLLRGRCAPGRVLELR
jgi:glycosyltransferase involved in cell wall biosynthesis